MTGSSVAAAFSRRHYQAVADVLADLRARFDEGGACQFGVECAADDLAVMFGEDNARFNSERFRQACGIVSEAVCEWFALCENPATREHPHPVLGSVPICDRCAAKVEALA